VFVGEFNGPDACAAADVEHVLDVIGDGRAEEFAIEGEAEGVVLEI
jgi:hypothetical protein